MKQFCLILALAPIFVFSSKLVELQLKTQNAPNAGMDLEGNLGFDICAASHCCYLYLMDYPYNQYVKGRIEGFTEGQLQECQHFPIPDGNVTELKITHSGVDAWLGEYIRLLMDTGIYYHCPINDWLDNAEHMYLDCKIGQ